MSSKSNTKKLRRQQEQQRRLAIFVQDYDHYEEREINGEIWVKQYDAANHNWIVAIYSRESFRRYKNFSDNLRELDRQFKRKIN
jgi:hypothetical protein